MTIIFRRFRVGSGDGKHGLHAGRSYTVREYGDIAGIIAAGAGNFGIRSAMTLS
jgi:hypothetical protein